MFSIRDRCDGAPWLNALPMEIKAQSFKQLRDGVLDLRAWHERVDEFIRPDDGDVTVAGSSGPQPGDGLADELLDLDERLGAFANHTRRGISTCRVGRLRPAGERIQCDIARAQSVQP